MGFLRHTISNCHIQQSCRNISWFNWMKTYDALDGLKHAYNKKLLPLEEHSGFHEIQSPRLHDADFEAKPLILLMGQYSTGKTTFIRYLLQSDFPGMRIGPEPTTDKFIAIMNGPKEGIIPGNALVSDKTKPFGPLVKYGNIFMSKLQCSLLPSPVLNGVSIIDTPGILSGEKQRVDRGYDFIKVIEWFAGRVDRIILLFDANKLDISDEFRLAIESLQGNEEKIKIVLNKADSMDQRSLIRVYGALMWSLGKIFKTPEVAQVFIGSFWDKPLVYSDSRHIFEEDSRELIKDIQALPVNSVLRKLNDISKRARLVQVHALIMNEMFRDMPYVFFKEAKKNKLISSLPELFKKLPTIANISPGDLPDVKKMQAALSSFDFSRINPPDERLLRAAEEMQTNDIPKLMALSATEGEKEETEEVDLAFARDTSSPFSFRDGEGFEEGRKEGPWVVSERRGAADATFDKLCPDSDKMSRSLARAELLKSGLPSGVLGQIYNMADVDCDGLLDRDEFALAQYIVTLKSQGFDIPEKLPNHLLPPSKQTKNNIT